MPNLNIKSLMASLANTISDLGATLVSTIGEAPNTASSIFIARQTPPKPEHPYITVDFIGINGQGQAHRSSTIDDLDDSITYDFDQVVTLIVDVRDSSEGDSMGIANEVRNRLLSGIGLDSFEQNSGFPILDIGDINFSGTFMNTDFEEVSRFNVSVAARSSFTDTSTGVIESQELDGELNYLETTLADVEVSAPNN